MIFHNHRIVPGHMGGTYEPKNVIRVNVAMHAFLHKCLYDQHGRLEDLKAWKTLTSWIGKPAYKHTLEAKAKMSAERAGKPQGPHSPETRAKISAAHLGRKQSAEMIARRVAANTGQRRNAKKRATMAAAQRTRWAGVSDAKRAAIGAAISAAKRRNKIVH
jgi:hypothetical protein